MAKRPAKVPAAPAVRIETVPLSAIDLGVGIQPRAETNSYVASEYADAMREGATFPPVVIFKEGDVLRLVDGWHRHNAARSAGLTEIVAEVHDGDLEAATLYAVGANALHGERRTNADKRHAVTMALKQWPTDSDNGIARKCGVGPDLVGTVRRILSENDSIAATAERTFIHPKTGKPAKMKTGAIGKRPKARGEPPEAPSAPVATPPSSPPPTPAPAEEPIPEQEPASNVIPLGDRLKPIVTERQAEREAEAEQAKEDDLASEDYDEENPEHRAKVVAQAITNLWSTPVSPKEFWSLFQGKSHYGEHVARVKAAQKVINQLARYAK